MMRIQTMPFADAMPFVAAAGAREGQRTVPDRREPEGPGR